MEAGSSIIFLNITETKLNSRESRIKLPDGLALKIDKFLSHVVSIRIEIKLKVEMYKTKLTVLHWIYYLLVEIAGMNNDKYLTLIDLYFFFIFDNWNSLRYNEIIQ